MLTERELQDVMSAGKTLDDLVSSGGADVVETSASAENALWQKEVT